VQRQRWRRVAVGGEIHQAAAFVDGLDRTFAAVAGEHPGACSDRPSQPAVFAIEIEVAEAAAVRCPQECATLRQEGELVVQCHPAVAALLEQQAASTVGGLDPAQLQAPLVAALPLYGQRARGSHPELNVGIRPARCRVALADHAHRVCEDLEALELVDGRFGDAKLQRARASLRHGLLAAGGKVDHVQVLLAHEADVASPWRELRIGFGGGGVRQPAHRTAGGSVEIVEPEVAFDREQQPTRVGRELVVDDARQRGGALAFAALLLFAVEDRAVQACVLRAAARGDRGRVDQPGRAPARDVPGPEIELVLVVRAALQIGDEAAIGREARTAQRGAGEIGRGEDPLDRQFGSRQPAAGSRQPAAAAQRTRRRPAPARPAGGTGWSSLATVR